jgi:hypothetical protein
MLFGTKIAANCKKRTEHTQSLCETEVEVKHCYVFSGKKRRSALAIWFIATFKSELQVIIIIIIAIYYHN